MTQPKKNSTRIALIAPEDAQSYTDYLRDNYNNTFGEDKFAYMKYQTNPARYLAEERGETYTTVDPSQQIEVAPLTSEQWMKHAAGDRSVVPAASERQVAERIGPLEMLGISEAPIIKMSADPEIQDTRERETLFDHMSAKQWRKANRQLNRDERKLNRDIRRDSRIERAIADKFGDAYNPANRESMNRKFEAERERIEQMRKLLNNG